MAKKWLKQGNVIMLIAFLEKVAKTGEMLIMLIMLIILGLSEKDSTSEKAPFD